MEIEPPDPEEPPLSLEVPLLALPAPPPAPLVVPGWPEPPPAPDVDFPLEPEALLLPPSPEDDDDLGCVDMQPQRITEALARIPREVRMAHHPFL